VIVIKNILVATDFGEAADAALRYGIALTHRNEATLHVLHVVADVAGRATAAAGVPVNADAIQRSMDAESLRHLESLVPEPHRTTLHTRFVQLRSNTTAAAILAYARDEDIDLVIIGTHGRHGLAYFFLGSVAQHVSRSATCPVLTVRAHAREFIRPDPPQVVTEARK
jgi:nucleotide-binding universal stress UspA family protein